MKNTFPLDQVLEPSLDDTYSLTKREWNVLILVSEDFSNQKIGDILFITRSSVKAYRRRIGEKLQITGRDQLGRYVRKNQKWLVDKHFQLYPPPTIQ